MNTHVHSPPRAVSPAYRGRFAPSPTGPLHFGSLTTALGSYLQARSQQGEWVLRIDDIDPDRDSPEAARLIPRQLEALGLEWDGAIDYQSEHEERHRAALEALLRADRAFPCGCTRREVAAAGGVYPGTCRNGLPDGRRARSVRLRVSDVEVDFDDALQGHVSRHLANSGGDFIIRRADGLIAYQLAAAVDDVEGGYTEVVRGADLLTCTARQIHIHAGLGIPSPRYLHLPLMVNARGEKLSKQTKAAPLDTARPGPCLVRALALLGQQPPVALAESSPRDILDWAICSWNPARLDGVLRIELR